MGRARRVGCAIAILALAACGTGPAPNDVAEGVGFQDYQEYEARRAALRTAPTVTPQTALPPADVGRRAIRQPARGHIAMGRNVDLGACADRLGRCRPRRGRRHCRGRGGLTPAPAPAQQIATASTADDFVAPPLPEGMSVLGANVVAFALSTEHAVGERVYPRNPLRLGGRECAAAISAPRTSRRTGS
jgi:hypothetical protein